MLAEYEERLCDVVSLWADISKYIPDTLYFLNAALSNGAILLSAFSFVHFPC